MFTHGHISLVTTHTHISVIGLAGHGPGRRAQLGQLLLLVGVEVRGVRRPGQPRPRHHVHQRRRGGGGREAGQQPRAEGRGRGRAGGGRAEAGEPGGQLQAAGGRARLQLQEPREVGPLLLLQYSRVNRSTPNTPKLLCIDIRYFKLCSNTICFQRKLYLLYTLYLSDVV